MEHGTNSTYVNHKCRCDLCTEAHSEASRKLRAKRVEAGLTQRGTQRVAKEPRPRVRKRNREKEREYSLLRKYGLTLVAFNALVEAQRGSCASCGDPLELGPKTHVDHCHETGIVRGLLCANCNRALGLLGDSPAKVQGLFN